MNPYYRSSQAYKKASVNTYDQSTLILMLYDGAVKFLKVAQNKISLGKNDEAHYAIIRAKNIVSELNGSLNLENTGEIGNNLRDLYSFLYNRLIDANILKSSSHLDETIRILEDLRDGWRYIADEKGNSTPAQPSTRGNSKPINLEG